MTDRGSVLEKLENIVQRIGSGDRDSAIDHIDLLLHEDIEPLCYAFQRRDKPVNGIQDMEVPSDLLDKAVKLREQLYAIRSSLVRETGDALAVAYAALADWARGGQK